MSPVLRKPAVTRAADLTPAPIHLEGCFSRVARDEPGNNETSRGRCECATGCGYRNALWKI